MSFCSDQISYETIKQCLDAAKAENIAMQIEGLLEFAKRRLLISQQSIKNQTNRKRKDVIYSLGNWIWLNGCNIKTTRPYKDLESKYLGPYQIIAVYGRSYELRLPSTMRIHPVFSPKLLRPCANDPLLIRSFHYRNLSLWKAKISGQSLISWIQKNRVVISNIKFNKKVSVATISDITLIARSLSTHKIW